MTKWLVVVGAIGVATIVFVEMRCQLGFHPIAGRRMKTGTRTRFQSESVAEWECGRCNRSIAVTRLDVHIPTLRTLRSQVGASRKRSKVVTLQVVKKEKSA